MKTSIPFIDLSRIHKLQMSEFQQQIQGIIETSGFVLGPQVQAFERDFARYMQTAHAVGVASGLDALKLALLALEIGPGDEVIVPANTFIATAFAVSSTGATPVLVDVDAQTYNMTAQLAEKAITKKTKAILPVHLYGQAADLQQLQALAKKHKIYLVEDCAQAHGATHHGQPCGSWGDIGCFSFYPTKNLGALGDGGAITTNNVELADRVQILRNVGQKEKNQHITIGMNSRLDTMQAAILQLKLPHLNEHNASRQQAAKWYQEGLAECKGLTLPQVKNQNTHVYHLYVVAAASQQDREALKQHLSDQKIGVAVHYPTPIHLQPCYAHLKLRAGAFPVAERMSGCGLSLPMFPHMTQGEVATVCQAIREFDQNLKARGAA
jgi:dTDP-4-amino-4,6-dideoxygalactose transaminase